MKTALAVVLSLMTTALFGQMALADDYPSQAVKLIVPAGAGGGTDVYVRTISDELSANLGAPVAVINVPGAGTVAGSRRVVEADPDGYTALTLHSALHLTHLTGKADYNYEDFEVCCGTTSQPIVVVVKDDSPYQSLKGLFDAAAANPGKLVHASNLGAVNHLAMLAAQTAYEQEYGVKAPLNYVQVGGGAASIASILGGHSTSGIVLPASVKSFSGDEGVRAIAVLADERLEDFPDLPTAREGGVPVSFAVDYWWFFPKDTPSERVAAFEAAMAKTFANPEIQKKFRDLSIDPTYTDRETATQQVVEQYEAMESLLKSAGLAK